MIENYRSWQPAGLDPAAAESGAMIRRHVSGSDLSY